MFSVTVLLLLLLLLLLLFEQTMVTSSCPGIAAVC
jgi:hypothetical protein